jgi:hypothetical protein
MMTMISIIYRPFTDRQFLMSCYLTQGLWGFFGLKNLILILFRGVIEEGAIASLPALLVHLRTAIIVAAAHAGHRE